MASLRAVCKYILELNYLADTFSEYQACHWLAKSGHLTHHLADDLRLPASQLTDQQDEHSIASYAPAKLPVSSAAVVCQRRYKVETCNDT